MITVVNKKSLYLVRIFYEYINPYGIVSWRAKWNKSCTGRLETERQFRENMQYICYSQQKEKQGEEKNGRSL